MKKCYMILIFVFVIFLTSCGTKKLESILLTVDKRNVSINETKKIKVQYNPENVMEELIWSSSNSEVASVQDGVITGKNIGTAIITAITKDGIKDEITIEVYKKAESIELDKTNVELTIGDTIKINAKVIPDDATYSNIFWTTSDYNVASVDLNGLITANNIGKATINATTIDGISASLTVNVQGNKENAFYNENVRWGMSLEEVQDELGMGDSLMREPDIYLRYTPRITDYYRTIVSEYVYWFYNNQLRAYWLDYSDSSCNYNEYLDIRKILIEKYGNPSSENYNWKDKTYKNEKDKWDDAFRYDDFTIKTIWYKSKFNILINWDHSSKSCSVSYSQKEWTSKL